MTSSTINSNVKATPPYLITPVDAGNHNIIPFRYSFDNQVDTVSITFIPTSYGGLDLIMDMDAPNTNTILMFNYNPQTNPISTISPAYINSADFTSVPDGTYNIRLSYDSPDGFSGSETANDVVVDTMTAPIIVNSPSRRTNSSYRTD